MLSTAALQELQEALMRVEGEIAAMQEQAQHLRAVIAHFGPKSAQRGKLRESSKPASSMQHVRDAAELVLQEAGEPLHYRDIHRLIAARGIEANGKDPARVVGAQLSADDARFYSIGANSGKWGLVAWRQHPPQRRESSEAEEPTDDQTEGLPSSRPAMPLFGPQAQQLRPTLEHNDERIAL